MAIEGKLVVRYCWLGCMAIRSGISAARCMVLSYRGHCITAGWYGLCSGVGGFLVRWWSAQT
jgi:hypothetical protein